MSLTEKLLKNSTLKKRATLLSESKLHNDRELIPTSVPAINIALSGEIDKGIGAGILTIAGKSKHFKTMFGLVCVSAFLKAKKDSVCLFYDSEFGAGQAYFESVGIDSERVVHIPITNVEELKFDIMNQLENIEYNDNVIIFIDSIGNLASKKEVEDAVNEKSVADMTRAKSLNSLWRMVTPHLTLKNIPLININHVYSETGLFPKTVLSGGEKGMLSSDAVWFIGRQQEKAGTDVVGYNFIINIEKSRYVKEKSKIPVNVTWETGINKWSGLLDIALETGHVLKPSNGYYCRAHIEGDKKVRLKDTHNSEFWGPVFSDTDFSDAIAKKFKVAYGSIMKEEEADV
jgi:RecA/RadA recombinase